MEEVLIWGDVPASREVAPEMNEGVFRELNAENSDCP